MSDLPAIPLTDDIIKRIAMDIGKEVVDHLDNSWPEVFGAVMSPASFRVSVRNATYNAVMMHIRAADKGETDKLIRQMEASRRRLRKLRAASPGGSPTTA